MKERKNLYLGISGWAILLASAMSFTSCADDDIIDSSQLTTGKGICFNIANDNEAWQPDSRTSKAESTTTFHSENPDDGFSITATTTNGIRSFVNTKPQSRGTQTKEPGNDWSYKVGAYYYANANATPIDFFTENATGGLTFGSEGTGTSTYYWPKNGNISFFAVAPANIQGFNVPTAENIAAPSFTYTIDSDVTKHQDIMVAQTAAINTPTAPVGLQFQHLLAAVQFKMGDMIATQVNSITISGIKGGEVTFGYSDGKWTPTSYGNTTSYALTLGTQDQEGNWEAGKLANTLNLDDKADITGNGNNSMLLLAPQELLDAKVTVNYTELLVLDNGEPKTTEKTINLPEHIWEAGKTYAYTLNIKSGLSITIPRPDDQDAHYVMVEMNYNLTGVSDDITDLTASIEYINNTASNDIKPTLKMKADLTELQSAGYWTETQYDAVVNEDGTTSYNNDYNIRGNETLPLTSSNKSGTLVIFLPENNGKTDREVVLRITGKYNNTTLNIGSGSFKQYCPCWSEDGTIGVERFEEINTNGEILTHPWGFKYTRKAEYRFFSLLNLFLPYVFEQQFGYEGSFYTIEKFSFLTIKYWSVNIDYTALNHISGANKEDGLQNTKELFNHVGNDGGISELETFCKTYKSLIGDTFTLQSESGENKVPDDFAAYEALKRNKFVEVLYKNDAGSEIMPMIFEEDMQWFLPSTTEAQKLRETKLDSNGNEVNSINALQGTYWSSNRHAAQDETETDDDTKAFTITYTDGECTITDADRMNNNKIRAVRKAGN